MAATRSARLGPWWRPAAPGFAALAIATAALANAAVVGAVVDTPEGIVALRTGFGGSRIVDMLVGDPHPRIC
jgi:hydrogenase expression/formation protein HypE